MKIDSRSDAELVALLRNGEQPAFLELMERYTTKVHNLSMRITRNEEDAEEIMQDVFATVFRKINDFEGKSAFSSWLYRITTNTAFMKLRKRRQHIAVSIDDAAQAPLSSWAPERSDACDLNYISSRHEMKAALEAAVSKLPEDYRAIFILRDVDGLSNQEVGEILQLSVPAVKSRLHRSRSLLRKKLQKFYEDYCSEDKISYGILEESEGLRKAA